MLDAAERSILTGKQVDGINTTIKMMFKMGWEFPFKVWALSAKTKGATHLVPHQGATMLRRMLELPEKN